MNLNHNFIFFIKSLVLLATFSFWGTCFSQTFPAYGVIYNALDSSKQSIALGVNPEGHLNTPKGITLNAKNGSVGIAYKWSNGGYGKNGNYYAPGWYDATSPGCLCEGWGASAVDPKNKSVSGYASVDNGGVKNVKVKSFVVDSTSIKSTVWIYDSQGDPMLEVTHLYGPTAGVTNGNLFQSLVTITNISGGYLNDVRYERVMDWDIPHNEFNEYVLHSGVSASLSNTNNYPRLLNSCDNGFATPDPTKICTTSSSIISSSVDKDFGDVSKNNRGLGPDDHGSEFKFQFGGLECNESATFYIYYGAGSTSVEIENSLKSVGSTLYSIGSETYATVSYGFGFKGVSGTAVAPNLPTKVASLPAGINTDPSIYQTYAPPILGDGTIYQALFLYQKEKQWIGEIKRYNLDSAGAFKNDQPISASSKLYVRAARPGPFDAGGRSIWTVGFDSACMSGSISNDSQNNNFILANSVLLEKLLFNCPSTSNISATNDLINFVRGQNAYLEDPTSSNNVRKSVLGDTYHSEMVLVGVPNAPWSSDSKIFGKSEAYYRFQNGYSDFVASNSSRRSQIYVGANDGMLHAFDLELNERWAFIPPPVMPLLRNMSGDKGAGTVGGGKSNSIFTVDGPISVKDVYFNAEKTWKTVLIGGLGWGGNGYYALDITNPDKPLHLFSFNNDVPNKSIVYWDSSGKKSTFAYGTSCQGFDYSKLGGTWSRPVIMLMPYGGKSASQRWVATFGGGFAGGASVSGSGSTSSFGAYVFVIELEPDGSFITSQSNCGSPSSASVASTGGHILSAIPLCDVNQTYPLCGDLNSNIPNGVTANLSVITGDGTSLADYYGGIAYFTDLQGELWKFNLSKGNLNDDNSGLFTLRRSFRSESSLSKDRMGYNQLGTTIVSGKDLQNNTINRLFNYYGTGDLTRLQRRISTINNRIYGVSDDDFPKTTLAASDQTVSNFTNIDNQSCTVNNSWYANVWAKTGLKATDPDYQKIVGRASIFNKYVYFSAYQPEAQSCPRYGQSRLIEITDTCQQGGAGGVIGQGLATSPVIDNKGNIYVGMSNLAAPLVSGRDNIAKLTSSAKSSTGKIQYKSWREKRAY